MRYEMRRLMGVLPLVLLFNCATMINGRDEIITIDSEPAGANVAVKCENGSTYNEVTPMSVPLRRNAGDCNVSVAKDGYAPQDVVLESGISSAFWGNMITVPLALCSVVGFVGVLYSEADNQSRTAGTLCAVTGLTMWAVDGKTGAWRDHDPKKLHVVLKPSG